MKLIWTIFVALLLPHSALAERLDGQYARECREAVGYYAGLPLSLASAEVQLAIFGKSSVEWAAAGVHCEFTLTQTLWSLTIGDQQYVYDGYPSREAFEAAQSIDALQEKIDDTLTLQRRNVSEFHLLSTSELMSRGSDPEKVQADFIQSVSQMLSLNPPLEDTD